MATAIVCHRHRHMRAYLEVQQSGVVHKDGALSFILKRVSAILLATLSLRMNPPKNKLRQHIVQWADGADETRCTQHTRGAHAHTLQQALAASAWTAGQTNTCQVIAITVAGVRMKLLRACACVRILK